MCGPGGQRAHVLYLWILSNNCGPVSELHIAPTPTLSQNKEIINKFRKFNTFWRILFFSCSFLVRYCHHDRKYSGVSSCSSLFVSSYPSSGELRSHPWPWAPGCGKWTLKCNIVTLHSVFGAMAPSDHKTHSVATQFTGYHCFMTNPGGFTDQQIWISLGFCVCSVQLKISTLLLI